MKVNIINSVLKSNLLIVILLTFNGHLIWAQSNLSLNWVGTIAGRNQEISNDMALDAQGNIYITGRFLEIIDADPGTGVSNLTSQGSNDIFIVKLSNQGEFQWAKSIGGSGPDEAFAISLDRDNNVHVTGFFTNTVDFDPGSGSFSLTSQGNTDIFVLKLTQSGDFVWAKSIGSTGVDRSEGITVDQNGNIYITGGFQGTVDFDPGLGVFNLTTFSLLETFITKLDTNGDLIWAKATRGFTPNTQSSGFAIAVDSEGGSIRLVIMFPQ